MAVDWTLVAASYLDQLPPAERTNVVHAVDRLPAEWDTLGEAGLQRLVGDLDGLYSLRVGADLRVLVRRHADVVTVVDIIRKTQIDALRRLAEAHEPAPG